MNLSGEYVIGLIGTAFTALLTACGFAIRTNQRSKSNTYRLEGLESDVEKAKGDLTDLKLSQAHIEATTKTMVENQKTIIELLKK